MPKTEDKYIVALDIGTSKVCVLVGEVNDRAQLEIIGKGTAPMKGTRRGNIINLDQAIDAVKKAVDEAEVMAGLQIDSVYAGISGDHIRSVNSRGVVSIAGNARSRARTSTASSRPRSRSTCRASWKSCTSSRASSSSTDRTAFTIRWA